MDVDFSDPESYSEQVAQAIVVLAAAVRDVAYQIKCLGNGNVITDMGAIEALGKEVKDGMQLISSSILDAQS